MISDPIPFLLRVIVKTVQSYLTTAHAVSRELTPRYPQRARALGPCRPCGCCHERLGVMRTDPRRPRRRRIRARFRGGLCGAVRRRLRVHRRRGSRSGLDRSVPPRSRGGLGRPPGCRCPSPPSLATPAPGAQGSRNARAAPPHRQDLTRARARRPQCCSPYSRPHRSRLPRPRRGPRRRPTRGTPAAEDGGQTCRHWCPLGPRPHPASRA